jgi:hypothetical protein
MNLSFVAFDHELVEGPKHRHFWAKDGVPIVHRDKTEELMRCLTNISRELSKDPKHVGTLQMIAYDPSIDPIIGDVVQQFNNNEYPEVRKALKIRQNKNLKLMM